MSRFTILDTPLSGLRVVQRQRIEDERGFLSRLFCAEELAAEDYADPLRLLARAVAFTDPVTGQARRFASALSLLPD